MMIIDKFRVHKFPFYELLTMVALRSFIRKKQGRMETFLSTKKCVKKKVKFVQNDAMNTSFCLSLTGQGFKVNVVRGNKQLLD